jgi:hypothetical protein
MPKYITNYWLEHYCDHFCTLCGCRGVIDTRGVKTPGGAEVGRLNWCICPNGQALRKQSGGPPDQVAFDRYIMMQWCRWSGNNEL